MAKLSGDFKVNLTAVSTALFAVVLFSGVVHSSAAFAVAEPEPELQDITSDLQLINSQAWQKRMVIAKTLPAAIEENIQKRISFVLELDKQIKADQERPIFLDSMVNGISVKGVFSQQLIEQLNQELGDANLEVVTGYSTTQNSTLTGNANPYAGISAKNDAELQEILDNNFCVPESINSSKECIAKKGSLVSYYENFVDFIVGEKPWNVDKISDIAMLSRRFLAGGADLVYLNQGLLDPSILIAKQSGTVQKNLRVAVLNDLASRRAPTSQATGEVLATLFKILIPSGQISSTNYKKICVDTKPADRAVPENYVCSMALSLDKDTTLVSQASIDKIFQYDYLLSSEFYTHINSGSSTGNMDKVQVYLKAQQLAQDYRALRLLQMRTTLMAVNLMNKQ